MLVQPRADALRLVRQHDHGLVAGALAGGWRAPPCPSGLPWTTVVAASLHDVAWQEEDRAPRLDPTTGRPHDFLTLPDEARERMREGLGRLEEIDPTVGALVREHHEALRENRDPTGEAAWVRFADVLSLHVCLTAPGGDPSALPGWLGPGAFVPPGGGATLATTWLEPSLLRFEPFPFAGRELRLEIPFRDLPRRRYLDPADLRRAWESSVEDSLTLRVVG